MTTRKERYKKLHEDLAKESKGTLFARRQLTKEDQDKLETEDWMVLKYLLMRITKYHQTIQPDQQMRIQATGLLMVALREHPGVITVAAMVEARNHLKASLVAKPSSPESLK
ncbi:hypothetical protein [Enterococcus asini]|uniref:hypothetical protein n=1 Tax=Enterococcus asini TaxID=57732 RepID=UPI00216B66A2|nr:hypothetical protein [Enterococcus asini]